jgi:hypothetical protein
VQPGEGFIAGRIVAVMAEVLPVLRQVLDAGRDPYRQLDYLRKSGRFQPMK